MYIIYDENEKPVFVCEADSDWDALELCIELEYENAKFEYNDNEYDVASRGDIKLYSYYFEDYTAIFNRS